MSIAQQRYLQAAKFTAATGRYSAALNILDLVKDESLQGPAQMLRGKIYAQMGRYADAISLWEKMLAKSPNDPEITRALQRVKQMQETSFRVPSGRGRLILASAGCIGVLVLLAVAYGFGRWSTLRDQQQQPGLAESGPAITQLSSTFAKDLQAHALAEREAVAAAIGALEQKLQKGLSEQALAITNQIVLAVSHSLKGEAETRQRLDSLSSEVAKGSMVTEVAKVAQDIHSDLNSTRQFLDGWTGSASNEIQLIRAQENQVMREQSAQRQSTDSLVRGIETVRSEVEALNKELARQASRSDQLLRTTVEALKPGNMDRLAREIKETEQALRHLKVDPTSARTDGKVLFTPNRAVLNEIRALESQLKSLQEQWEVQVAPWLRTKSALAEPANPSSSSVMKQP